LFSHKVFVLGIGYNNKIFNRNNFRKPVESLLQKSASGTQDIKKLFWSVQTAQRPETAAGSTRHYNAIGIVHAVKVLSLSKISILCKPTGNFVFFKKDMI
jgi:hypothetical protein